MSQTLILALAGGLFGAVIGSWLTAVCHRLPRRIDVVSDRSRCPACQTQIAARDNLPLAGYLMLGGRCRACRAPIPARYPLIEAATGATGVAIALWWWQLGVLVALAILVVPTLVSLATRRPKEHL